MRILILPFPLTCRQFKNKGREGKGREEKRREEKRRKGKGREGKGREGKGRRNKKIINYRRGEGKENAPNN